MKLHSPAFERAMKRRIREVMRSKPKLKRQKHSKPPARVNRSQWIVRPLMTIGLWLLVWRALLQTTHLETGLAIINIWAFAFVFVQAGNLIRHLYGAGDLTALALLPVSESTVFSWQQQKFIRGTLWLLGDLLGAYAVLGVYANCSALQFGVILVTCIVTWVETLALAAFCVSRRPGWPYHLAWAFLFMCGVVLFLGRELVGGLLLRWLDSTAPSLNLLLPTAWPSSLALFILGADRWVFLFLLVPTALIIASYRKSITRLRADYHYGETVIPESPEIVPGNLEGEPNEGDLLPAPPPVSRIGVTTIEEYIQRRGFLEPVRCPENNWFQRMLWRWLSDREKRLCELAFPNGFAILRPWRTIFRNTAVAIVAGTLAGFYSLTAEYWILGLGLLIAGGHMLTQIYSTGAIFQRVQVSGVIIPFYACYPAAFWNLGKLFIKHTFVQLPFVLLLSILWITMGGYLADMPIFWGVLSGFKVGVMLLFGRLMVLSINFSSGTNDTSAVRLSTLPVLFGLLLLGAPFPIFGLLAFIPDSHVLAFISLTLAAGSACLFYWVYGWFYGRRRFDLMTMPKG